MHSEDLFGCGFPLDGQANRFSLRAARSCDDVGECRVVEYTCRGISHVQEDLVKCAVLNIPCYQHPQLIHIPKRGEWSTHHTNDVAESDLGWSTPQPPPACTAARALNDPGLLQFEQDQTEKFYRQVTFRSYVPNCTGSLLVSSRKRHQGVQCV